MALFSKKDKAKKTDKAKTQVIKEKAPKPDKKAKGGAKKRKDSLVSIFNESVTEAAIVVFRENEVMTVEKDGKTLFVGMLLDTNDPSIGGINSKSKRDEDKGQIIEHINSGNIHAYLPLDYLENDKLIFIPDAMSLAIMSEFSLLTEARYTLAMVDEDGSIEETGCEITYGDIENIVTGKEELRPYFSSVGYDIGEEEDEGEYEEEMEEDEGEFEDDGEEEPMEDDVPFGSEETIEDVDMETEVMPGGYETNEDAIPGETYEDAPDESYDEPDYGADDTPDDDAMMEQVEIDDIEVTEEEVSDAITRKFYSDDLGLEVTTEPFDALFKQSESIPLFDENRNDGWLNTYLNERSKAANNELQRIHKENLFKARELYYSLISKHAEEIQKELDMDDPNTVYGQQKATIDELQEEAYQKVAKKVAERRKEIDDQWGKAIEQVGEDAKVAAQQQYRDRYGRQREEAIRKIEATVNKEIEDEYSDAIRMLLNERRMEAAKKMDYGITETLAEVSKVYEKSLEEERRIYNEYHDELRIYLDTNLKEDIARTRALEKELAQKSKADLVLAEYEQKIRTIKEEYESRLAGYEKDRQLQKQAYDEREARFEKDLERKEARFEDEKAKLRSEIADLLTRYSDLDEKKAREYANQLAEAKGLAQAWSDKYDGYVAMHKRSKGVAIVALIAGIAASLAIGVLVGANIAMDYGFSDTITVIEEDFNERLDSLEDIFSSITSSDEDEDIIDVEETEVITEDETAE